jgi:hypothetical protein
MTDAFVIITNHHNTHARLVRLLDYTRGALAEGTIRLGRGSGEDALEEIERRLTEIVLDMQAARDAAESQDRTGHNHAQRQEPAVSAAARPEWRWWVVAYELAGQVREHRYVQAATADEAAERFSAAAAPDVTVVGVAPWTPEEAAP